MESVKYFSALAKFHPRYCFSLYGRDSKRYTAVSYRLSVVSYRFAELTDATIDNRQLITDSPMPITEKVV